jgi:hypothetical protein
MKKYILLSLSAAGVLILGGFGVVLLARARAASQIAEDECNIKMIVLATISHTDQNKGLLPSASIPHRYLPPDRRLSWLVSIHPQLSCDGLYSEFARDEAWDSERNLPVAKTYLPTYLCPVARQENTPPVACVSEGPRPTGVYTTSYVGLSGVGRASPFLPLGDKECGFFGHDRRARYPSDITDGPGQTIMVMETAHRNGPWAAGHEATLRWIDAEIDPQVCPGGLFGRVHGVSWFWSSDGKAVAAVGMGDGSCRGITSTISPQTLAAAVTIAGEDVLGDDW